MDTIVTYIDLMEVGEYANKTQTSTLNQLFLKAISMNDMGCSEGYETDYYLSEGLRLRPTLIDYISLECKLNLIETWDYKVLSVDGENYEHLKDKFTDNTNESIIVGEDGMRYYHDKIMKLYKLISESSLGNDDSIYSHAMVIMLIAAKMPEIFTNFTHDMKKCINNL